MTTTTTTPITSSSGPALFQRQPLARVLLVALCLLTAVSLTSLLWFPRARRAVSWAASDRRHDNHAHGSSTWHGTCLDHVRTHTVFDEPFARPRAIPAWSHRVSGAWPPGKNASRDFFVNWRPEWFLLRYKVLNGTAYVESTRRRTPAGRWAGEAYQAEFEEMLVMATYLYDLPDVDLVFSWTDQVLPVVHDFPVLGLAYSSAVGQPAFAVPHHRNWKELGYSRSQLSQLAACFEERYPLASKQPKVFWRGTATGGTRMGKRVGALNGPLPHGGSEHPSLQVSVTKLHDEPILERMQRNQRVYFALTSHMYPYMDLGFTMLHLGEYGVTPGSPEAAFLTQLLSRRPVPWEDWNRYAVLLSIAGHGFTDRLPMQLLFSSPVLHVDSDVVEWFSPLVVPGANVEGCRADVSDFAAVAERLVEDAVGGGNRSRVEAMVAAAHATAVDAFNFFSFMDAFGYILANVSRACGWQVQRQAGEFEPVLLPASAPWMLAEGGLPDNARVAVQRAKRDNFVPAYYARPAGCFVAAGEGEATAAAGSSGGDGGGGAGAGMHLLETSATNMTVASCAAVARRLGYTWWGVRAGVGCYGFDRRPGDGQAVAESWCSGACSGGRSVPYEAGCGGEGHVAVYEGGESWGLQVVHVGCAAWGWRWSSGMGSGGARAGGGTVVAQSDAMTVQECAHWARAAGARRGDGGGREDGDGEGAEGGTPAAAAGYFGLAAGRVCVLFDDMPNLAHRARGGPGAADGKGGPLCGGSCPGGRTLGDVGCGGRWGVSVYSLNCQVSDRGPCYPG